MGLASKHPCLTVALLPTIQVIIRYTSYFLFFFFSLKQNRFSELTRIVSTVVQHLNLPKRTRYYNKPEFVFLKRHHKNLSFRRTPSATVQYIRATRQSYLRHYIVQRNNLQSRFFIVPATNQQWISHLNSVYTCQEFVTRGVMKSSSNWGRYTHARLYARPKGRYLPSHL